MHDNVKIHKIWTLQIQTSSQLTFYWLIRMFENMKETFEVKENLSLSRTLSSFDSFILPNKPLMACYSITQWLVRVHKTIVYCVTTTTKTIHTKYTDGHTYTRRPWNPSKNLKRTWLEKLCLMLFWSAVLLQSIST